MTGWPDPERPGVPLNPERDGWHWLIESDGRPHPDFWIAAHPGWRYAGLADRARVRVSAYAGPCLTPDEVQSHLAAAQREGAEEMRERAIAAVERVRREKDAARLSEWGYPNSDEMRRCYSYAEGAASDAAAAIRALAVEGANDV